MEDKKSKQKFRPNPKLKLMEQVHEVLRYHHYAYKTEQTYSQWILRYIHFFECKIHPAEVPPPPFRDFFRRLLNRVPPAISYSLLSLPYLIFTPESISR
ncbi:MAG: hypothetical protein D3921_08545 [Candidatus Electrothrix sp. AW1]|nr:hypothetical protein [Candidatus Electrothrix sp. AX1]MCI5127340.1 hypothetical protein [Candidatus Electrothrix gigas]MCI5182552.1 hypothetical protein [Candidatus Electrothrix gigas]